MTDGPRDEVCTAVVHDGRDAPNILFTPPCICPRCRPDLVYDAAARSGRNEGWLRVPGRAQRYRVERFELGTAGRTALGEPASEPCE